MPFVDNSGVDIHYHVEGEGPPLVLQHGLTNSLKTWYAYGVRRLSRTGEGRFEDEVRHHGKTLCLLS